MKMQFLCKKNTARFVAQTLKRLAESKRELKSFSPASHGVFAMRLARGSEGARAYNRGDPV
jgi:hypothetical protein